MLKLKPKHQGKFKCALHPKRQYGDERAESARCAVCTLIFNLKLKRAEYDSAERAAESAIARQRVSQK